MTGKLSILNDRKTVATFLREVLKLLLIVAIEEPELIEDLKGMLINTESKIKCTTRTNNEIEASLYGC